MLGFDEAMQEDVAQDARISWGGMVYDGPIGAAAAMQEGDRLITYRKC